MNPSTRSGIIAIVGRANVGKSSLLNRLVGEKVTIVSPVAQTTRSVIRAVLTEPRGQLVFLDTPGMHRAQHDLGRLMNKSARASIQGADLVLLILDCSTPPREEDDGWMHRLVKENIPCMIAFNKSDLRTNAAAAYRTLWANLVTASKHEIPQPHWLDVSALTGLGLPQLVDTLFSLMPEAPPLFDEEMLTDFPRKLAIADIVREKYFEHLRDELPHAIAVDIREIEETPALWTITGDIYVDRPSQKPIILGNKGRLFKDVMHKAETELSAIYETRVKLDLWIKVEPGWSKNFWTLRRLGYTT